MRSRSVRILVALLATAVQAGAMNPDDPGPGDVAFMIDASGAGKAISPHIYGVNGSLRPSGVGGIRLGGNRWTGYNWETNNSNAGEDYFHVNDGFLVNRFPNPNSPPGDAVLPTLQETASLGAVANVTVPMAGYVSADDDGTVTPGQLAPSSRWNEVRTRKSSVYPGSSLSLTPNLGDNYVFTDEFVNWVETNRQNGQEVMYLLDNEPSLWDNTHPYLWGSTGPTFAQVGQLSMETASAIKDVAPNAKVLGGVTFGWSGMQSLQDAPDFLAQVADDGGRQLDKLQFNRWLLKTMAEEEQSQGRTLMDVLDLHWYPEAQGGGARIIGTPTLTPEVIEARVQAPRSLWDETYFEDSYITRDILRDYSGQGNDQGVELLNRVRDDIDELKPGTLISISEYNYGGGNHISGGIAQADVLGVFGREGVYNAAWWPIEGQNDRAFTEAGFEMFTDFDGQGGRFGDVSLEAVTDDDAQSSIYASRSEENPDELILVAINRTGAPLEAAVQITDGQRYTTAEVFQLTGASAQSVDAGEFAIDLVNAFLYEMPAYSVSTIRLTAAPAPGDFNGDGAVNALDYATWREGLGTLYDASDLDAWRASYGAGTDGAVGVPTPASVCLTLAGVGFVALGECLPSCRRRQRPAE